MAMCSRSGRSAVGPGTPVRSVAGVGGRGLTRAQSATQLAESHACRGMGARVSARVPACRDKPCLRMTLAPNGGARGADGLWSEPGPPYQNRPCPGGGLTRAPSAQRSGAVHQLARNAAGYACFSGDLLYRAIRMV